MYVWSISNLLKSCRCNQSNVNLFKKHTYFYKLDFNKKQFRNENSYNNVDDENRFSMSSSPRTYTDSSGRKYRRRKIRRYRSTTASSLDYFHGYSNSLNNGDNDGDDTDEMFGDSGSNSRVYTTGGGANSQQQQRRHYGGDQNGAKLGQSKF